MTVKNYQELVVWQRAMDLVEDVYRLSKQFPREELYALTSQFGEPSFLFHRTSLKAKDEEQYWTFSDIYQSRTDRYAKSKLKL